MLIADPALGYLQYNSDLNFAHYVNLSPLNLFLEAMRHHQRSKQRRGASEVAELMICRRLLITGFLNFQKSILPRFAFIKWVPEFGKVGFTAVTRELVVTFDVATCWKRMTAQFVAPKADTFFLQCSERAHHSARERRTP